MKKLLVAITLLTCCVGPRAPMPAGKRAPNSGSHQQHILANGAEQTRKDEEQISTLQGVDTKGDGQDIVSLIASKKIQVETQGSGIQRVTLRIKKLIPESISLRVPVGTFMVSSNSGSQNMVTTSSETLTLSDGDWHTVSPDAACANRPRDIPGGDDTFKVLRSPHQAELAKLMPILDAAGVSYPTRQAAVWIITDNADYADLGSLQQSVNGVSQGRVIGADDTAQAMRIVEMAGISIRSKAIWSDRQQIMRALSAGELKAWLGQ